MALLKYIDPYFHRFYEELFGEATQNEEDPDIEQEEFSETFDANE